VEQRGTEQKPRRPQWHGVLPPGSHASTVLGGLLVLAALAAERGQHFSANFR